jgi:uncharacterized protein (DUF2126 family)
MGGEPTFVSIDDFESSEWNTAAVGPTKRGLADQLIRRLRERFAPGGVLHYGQGKWYPGETLPRWTFSLFWRTDGTQIWKNPDLIALEDSTPVEDPSKAGALLEAIAEHLDLPKEHVQPVFEDPAEWIVKEANLPENLSPQNPKLKDAEERARFARVFGRGLETAVGYVLPVQSWQSKSTGPKWRSERWRSRRGHLFLVPGDSPAGFRLPLGSLPYIRPVDYPYTYTADPSLQTAALPDYQDELHAETPACHSGRN